MAISTWTGVSVNVQSAADTAVPITAISKASPAVVTHGGTDPADGDWVIISAQGMNKVNAGMYQVQSAAAGSFELRGVDSTTYDTFASGSFVRVTLGTSVGTFRGLSASGGEFADIDITTIHDTIDRSIQGNASAISYDFTSLWDPTDAGLTALKAFSDTQQTGGMTFTFRNGAILAFQGAIGATLLPTGNAGEVVETPVSVKITGPVSVYAN